MLYLFSLTIYSYQIREKQVEYNFSKEQKSYFGEILNFPQQKKHSLACEVQLFYPISKKILLYIETEHRSQELKPGDQIILHTSVNPLKNMGNPDEFDYKSFMEGKGFSGTAYINSIDWLHTGLQSRSLKARALRVRGKALDVYKTFNLNQDEYAFLSALTLGYKADLSNEVKEAFRASGTSHVLAVSGLHVGIIYIIIIFLFSFLGKRGRWHIVKQVLVLLFLWAYVYITGFSVSVIRAAFMLSIVSVGNIFHRKGLTYNTLACAAFFILIINPFYLFDVGFQLSFSCVFSILFFQPKISKLHTPKFKLTRYFWNLFTASIAAQLGAFPLSLYYFDSFPTYFLFSNLLILPLIGLIIYLGFTLTIVSSLAVFKLNVLHYLYNLIAYLLQIAISSVIQIAYYFESLPMAVMSVSQISLPQTVLIFVVIYMLTFYIITKRKTLYFMFLFSIVLFTLSNKFHQLNLPPNQFIVYNNYTQAEMGYRINGNKIALEVVTDQVVEHPSSSIFLLTKNIYKSKTSEIILPIDYLILSKDNSFSMFELYSFYRPKFVIIDSSISRYTVAKIIKECRELNLPFHDISESGSFSIYF